MHAAYNESPYGKLRYCNNWENQNTEQPQYCKIMGASSDTNGNLKFILQKEKKNACLHRNWEAHS